MYNAVTREYLVNTKQNGKLIGSRVVRTREELEEAMTRFDGIPLFTLDREPAKRRVFVRVRAELGSRTLLYFIPTKRATDWVRSRRIDPAP
jgi:hypothetical protein